MDRGENELLTRPIPALVRKLAVPASVGFFFNTMYNVVDTYWGGKLSTEALAALSLSFPVFFIIIAAGSGLSTGLTALIANALGGGRREDASRLSAQGASFSVLVSIVLSIVGIFAAPKLFMLLGADGSYLGLSLSYMNVIFLGTVFFLLSYALNSTLNATGDTKTFRNFLIAGFFLNLILDPMFMFGWLGLPALGLKGVALATVVIELLGCVYLGWRVSKLSLSRGRRVNDFIPNLTVFREIAGQSIPASLNMVTVGLGIFIITYFIAPFGQTVVAAYGIATRVEQIFLLPTIGLTVAALTLVGQSNGAGNVARARESVVVCLKYGIYIMTVGTIAIFFFAKPFMGIFTNDVDVISSGAFYLRIAAFLTWAYAVMFTNVSALQGMKKPLFAVWIGLGRQIIGPVLIFWLFSTWFGLSGIWWGIFLINWTAAIITMVYARRVFRQAELAERVHEAHN